MNLIWFLLLEGITLVRQIQVSMNEQSMEGASIQHHHIVDCAFFNMKASFTILQSLKKTRLDP